MGMISMVVGAATDDGATFVAKVDTGPVRVAVADNASMTSPTFTSSEAVDAQGVAKVSITGLDPDTRYWWQVEDNSTLDTGTTGQFRTHPTSGSQASYTIAVAGDAGTTPETPGDDGGELAQNRISNHAVFDTIRQRAISEGWLAFAHLGDLHYYDLGSGSHGISGGGSLSNYRTAYDDIMLQPRQHQLYREVSWWYIWDDHDYGPNDSDGTLATKGNAQDVYRERVPHFPLTDPDGIWQAPDPIGRVQYVLSDVRSERSPNTDTDDASKTMLGSAQKTWLAGVLENSTAEVLVWLMPDQWMGISADSWDSFQTERDELVALLDTHGWLDRMVMVYADHHALGINSGRTNEWGGFPVLQAASMDGGADSAALEGVFDVVPDTLGRNQYGTVTVTDLGAVIAVRLTAWEGTTEVGTYDKLFVTSEAAVSKEDVTVELFYDSVWNDHTSDVYVDEQIKIKHGKTDAYSSAKPASCMLTFKNKDGTFHPKNPNSSLFGKIGRNTPMRVSVAGAMRFNGEAASWVPRRLIKGRAGTTVTAHGISHRLGQGSIEPLSPIRDFVENDASDVVAYWPMEEGSLAASALGQGDGDPSKLQDVQFNNVFPDLFDIGGPLKELGTGSLAPWLPNGAADVSAGGFLTMDPDPSLYRIDFLASGKASDLFPLIIMVEGNGGGSSGDERTFLAHWISNTSGEAGQTGYGVDDGTLSSYLLTGTVVDTDTLGDGKLHHIRLGVNQVNTDEVRFRVWVDGSVESDETFNSESVTLDGVRAVGVETGGVIGHLVVRDNNPDLAAEIDAAFGSQGVTATDRMTDVAAQYDGLTVTFTGDTDDVHHVGPRYTETMLKVIRDAAAVDMGILHDDITTRQLRYRTGRDLYGQDAALTLDWDSGEIAPPLEPNIDDLDTRNRITVTRRDGQRFTTSDQGSIDDFGLVNASATLNLPADGTFLENQAGWRLHLGTADDMRFARVTVDLTASPGLVAAVTAMRPGDRLDLVNLPDDVSVDDVSLLALGWTETVGSHRRKVTFNCIPERPYRIAEVGGGAVLGTVGSEAAELNEDLDTTETSIAVSFGAGPDWDHEGTDYDIVINGERMTVTAVGAISGTFPDRVAALTVTRSVNGVVKTHTNEDPIGMAEPVYIGL